MLVELGNGDFHDDEGWKSVTCGRWLLLYLQICNYSIGQYPGSRARRGSCTLRERAVGMNGALPGNGS